MGLLHFEIRLACVSASACSMSVFCSILTVVSGSKRKRKLPLLLSTTLFNAIIAVQWSIWSANT